MTSPKLARWLIIVGVILIVAAVAYCSVPDINPARSTTAQLLAASHKQLAANITGIVGVLLVGAGCTIAFFLAPEPTEADEAARRTYRGTRRFAFVIIAALLAHTVGSYVCLVFTLNRIDQQASTAVEKRQVSFRKLYKIGAPAYIFKLVNEWRAMDLDSSNGIAFLYFTYALPAAGLFVLTLLSPKLIVNEDERRAAAKAKWTKPTQPIAPVANAPIAKAPTIAPPAPLKSAPATAPSAPTRAAGAPTPSQPTAPARPAAPASPTAPAPSRAVTPPPPARTAPAPAHPVTPPPPARMPPRPKRDG